MHAQADSQQRAELRQAFLRHLPKRAESIARRARRFCREGWDINALSVLFDDVQRLAGVSGRYGVLETSERLAALEEVLGSFLAAQRLPDADADARIVHLLDALAPDTETAPVSVPDEGDAAVRHSDSPRSEVAPPFYWRRWAGDAPPPGSPEPAPGPEEDTTPAPESVIQAAAASASVFLPDAAVVAAAAAPVAGAATSVHEARAPSPGASALRVHHLTDSGSLSIELDQRLEAHGYELELLDSPEELAQIVAAVAPDVVLVDPGFAPRLEAVSEAIRPLRERGAVVALVVIVSEDTVPLRLLARRARANLLLVRPSSADEVIDRLRELQRAQEGDARARILVVEDDRSQALFAESVLRNAGMEALVVTEAFEVLDAMSRFKPDLVLMDLYMPDCDGTELTALIREREEFLDIPIVFLSGESDQDKHFEALSVGGDDFLPKPIRPKYLIASVTNRVQRARALRQRSLAQDPRDPSTGLYTRAHVLDRLDEAVGRDGAGAGRGGVLLIEVDGVAALRERLGLSGVEQLLALLGNQTVQLLAGPELAARYGDGGLLVYCPDADDAVLEARGLELRRRLAGLPLSISGQALRARVSVGVCALQHGFADTAALLAAVERAAREARGLERGLFRHVPPRRADDEQEAARVAAIREALQHDSFELLYQPIVALQGGDEAQYQALLRLRDDSGRLHPAAEIVPAAVRNGLILDVDRWVLSQALRVIDQRRQEQRPVKLFVSQSATTLTEPGQAAWLAGQLQARRLNGNALVIELPQDEIGTRVDAVEDFCGQLLPSGVNFCLSRFESGMEGDAVLAQLPVQYIKLGPRYLSAAQTPTLRDELRVIVESAHRRGLSVIAQRVEDAQLAATLWMSGIDFIQGNLVQLAARDLDFDFQAAVL